MFRPTLLTLVAVLAIGNPGCGDRPKQSDQAEADAPLTVPEFRKQRVPSSKRSRTAIAKVAPSLVSDLMAAGLSYGSPIFIRIFKEERELELWVKGEGVYTHFRTYPIAAMSGNLGPKLREGDRQSPEGCYDVPPSRMNPNSRYHLSFNLGYPNEYDRAHGRTGSALMVHGNRASIGCYAMTDEKIEEIYAVAHTALANGQTFFRVHCFPFRMTPDNMKRHNDSEWLAFWNNLKVGYDAFERTRKPPGARVWKKKYVFSADAK